MTDLFKDKADEYDTRPLPQQISEGVFGALTRAVELRSDATVMDFGAGTGLVCSKIAPLVGKILAVDISAAMLEKLVEKPELKGKVEVFCQNILEEPLEQNVDVIVSAMAMHHVEDTRALLSTLFDHLVPGGTLAIADLDTEEGTFHPANLEGVHHAGFDRNTLGELIEGVGFNTPQFVTACEITKEDKLYPIFLMSTTKR